MRTHLWGTDLSGSLQGAGGVGGLLGSCLFNGGGSRYYPTYDGNGNVSEYLVGTTVVAHYEYDPFGNDITPAAKRGKLHNSFPFRFSTKYQDTESGQYSYGMRYYDPLTGRWLNHDPIEEDGGVNLYGFVGNDAVDYFDILGLERPAGVGPNAHRFQGFMNPDVSSTEYWDNWLNQFPKLKPKAEKDLKEKFEDGCIGITCINLGEWRKPDLSNCYLAISGQMKDILNAFDKAKALQKKMIETSACNGCQLRPGQDSLREKSRPRIFSVRFWAGNGSFIPGPDGRVNMSGWSRKGRPVLDDKGKKTTNTYVPFDFGLYEEGADKWIHANHDGHNGNQMKVYTSSLEHFSRPLHDFDKQVFCVACEKWDY